MSEVKKQDSDLLSIVSIFHYVLGGFQMLISLAGFVYIVMGILMITGAMDSAKVEPVPPELGWVFVGAGVVFVLIFVTIGLFTIKTGVNMNKRRNRTLCIVIDSILCLMVPFGTIVGIFGLVLLTKPEVSDQFEG
ncbi:MAG: hypothetical protein U9P42_07500 [Candidatus Fermentibacteria bacterium]|nr:hypothetical protein [Candidatus Fermentibacteria bacterium]